MKYVGVISNGSVVCDKPSETDAQPLSFELSVSKTKLFISFEEKEAEIKIGGKDYSLNDKGINIVVYDLKKSEVVDACCYNALEGKPTFSTAILIMTSSISTHISICPKSSRTALLCQSEEVIFRPAA